MNIGDIVEKNVGAPEPPKPPSANTTTFERKWRPKQKPLFNEALTGGKSVGTQAAGAPQVIQAAVPGNDGHAGGSRQPPLSEEEKIHLENIRKLGSMSDGDIAQEREELMQSMDPSILQSLLRRAELKEAEQDPSRFAGAPATSVPAAIPDQALATQHDQREHGGHGREHELDEVTGPHAREHTENEATALTGHPETHSAGEPGQEQHTLHFPKQPQELKDYFPDLPVENEKLAWMQPIGEDEDKEYSSEMAALAPSELRFDFYGNLITPRMSRLIPQSAGLHHHGDAPTAAGYTLPELAHLARSTVPSQRGMAIQTAGRVLTKLRQGKYSKSSELQFGLEQIVRDTRIMDTLYEAASDQTRSLTVKKLATEALWHIETAKKPGAESQ